jgi:transposase
MRRPDKPSGAVSLGGESPKVHPCFRASSQVGQMRAWHMRRISSWRSCVRLGQPAAPVVSWRRWQTRRVCRPPAVIAPGASALGLCNRVASTGRKKAKTLRRRPHRWSARCGLTSGCDAPRRRDHLFATWSASSTCSTSSATSAAVGAGITSIGRSNATVSGLSNRLVRRDQGRPTAEAGAGI